MPTTLYRIDQTEGWFNEIADKPTILDNGLVTNKRQSITWTNDDLVYLTYMRHWALMSKMHHHQTGNPRSLQQGHGAWWRHQMKTFSHYCPFVRGIHLSLMNSPHKGQWRGVSVFSFHCAWINDWVNNREAGYLRRHRTHYDVTVMEFCLFGGHNPPNPYQMLLTIKSITGYTLHVK